MNNKTTKNKIWKSTLTIALILSLSVFTLVGCSSKISSNQVTNKATNTNTAQSPVANSSTDTDGDGIPDSVEKTYGTNPYLADTDGDGVNDKEDKDPLTAENPIKETNTTPLEVTIKDARLEDNTTADHLEITLSNTGKTTLSEFDIFYTITDKGNSTQESYYQTLSGFSLNGGETKTIHFDNKVKDTGHYYGNMNGLYGTSANGLTFDVQLHAKGYQLMKFQVEKSKGTAEVAD